MNKEQNIWNDYLNEIRHDVIARQKQQTPTDEDIKLLGRVIYYLMSFSEEARAYGLLAMEEVAYQLDLENRMDAFLHKAAMMIVDGRSPECVAEVLSNYYWLNSLECYEAAAVYMGIRGVLLVQQGEHMLSITEIVCSVLPEELQKKCKDVSWDYTDKKRKKKEEIGKVYFETDFSRTDELLVRESLDWLERELSCLTEREIQIWLRNVDNNYLVPALVGMKQRSRQVIAKNMSLRLRAMIMVDCYQVAHIDAEAIAEAAEYLTEKLKVLQACGEIWDAECRLLYR